MIKVTPLRAGIVIGSIGPVPNEQLIAALNILLSSAEKGELQSFVGVGFCANGTKVRSFCSHGEDSDAMIGALVRVQNEYMTHTEIELVEGIT